MDSNTKNTERTIIKVICNDTKNSYLKEITSDILSLREILLIVLIIMLIFTNCYTIYYICSKTEPANVTPQNVEITNYSLYGNRHRSQSPRNEVIVTAVPINPK